MLTNLIKSKRNNILLFSLFSLVSLVSCKMNEEEETEKKITKSTEMSTNASVEKSDNQVTGLTLNLTDSTSGNTVSPGSYQLYGTYGAGCLTNASPRSEGANAGRIKTTTDETTNKDLPPLYTWSWPADEATASLLNISPLNVETCKIYLWQYTDKSLDQNYIYTEADNLNLISITQKT